MMVNNPLISISSGGGIGIGVPLYLDLPFVCKICAEIHPKNLPKNRNFTYMEDPGMDV